MNVSGSSIAATYRKSVASPKCLVLITDSLQHRVQTLSVKLGGSANGHNGVKSVIGALGGEAGFYRFRIGIGRNDEDAAAYVLRNLSSYEQHFWTGGGLNLVLSELENVAQKSST